MPVITVQISKQDVAQKTDLIRGLTAAAVEATKIPAQSFIVLINEFENNNLGIGGKSLTQIKSER